MFTVGEFARLAQVSKRLLRYYDEIGLLKPDNIGYSSGYRLYSAEQMSQLNRILALKELGLSLAQIQRTLAENISTDELRAMLLRKKNDIEAQLEAELRRVRMIESQLEAIIDAEALSPPNVILKQIPNQSVLSIRQTVDNFESGMELYAQIQENLPSSLRRQLLFCICHSDAYIETDLDMEMGLMVTKPLKSLLSMSKKFTLTQRDLPGSALMATTVVKGALENIHTGYAMLSAWIVQNEYRQTGIPRELCLQLPQEPSGSDFITEIQVPIEAIPNKITFQ